MDPMNQEELDAYIADMKTLLEASIRERRVVKTASSGERSFTFTITDTADESLWALAAVRDV